MRQITLPNNAEAITRDAGPAPMLQWVEIVNLVVDDRYQRPLAAHNWKNIRAIADQFLWSRFSPVLCAPVAGGKFAIIDGQHRTHAALLCEHKQVPCQIVQMDLAEQASSFKSVNANTTRVSGFHILRAALTAGEQWALDLRKIAEDGNCELMQSNASSDARKPGQLFSIHSFRKIAENNNHGTVSLALRTLMETEGFSADKDLWNANTIEPVLRAIIDHPDALKNEGFAVFLDNFDIYDAVDGLQDENKRRIGRGQPKLGTREYIYTELKNAIHEAFDPAEDVA